MKIISTLVILFTIVSFRSEGGGLPADSTHHKKKLSLTPFPAFFVAPENGVGYGALVVPVYNFGYDSLTRDSSGQLLGYLTTKKQSSLQLSYNIYTNQERYVITGEAKYFDYPIYYYGIGNENEKSDSSLITYKLINFQNRLLKQVKKSVFVGGQFQVNRLKDLSFKNPDSKIKERAADELDGSVISGIGPALLFDNRDNPLNTRQGIYAEFGTFFYRKSLGSEFNFDRYVLDVRKFIPLSDFQVLAFHGLGRFSGGRVPFREMAQLGNDKIMRGFYEGRFRDRQLVAIQSEYRHQVFSRVGFVLFGGVGKVGNQLNNLNLSGLKYGGGGGLRLMLNRKEKLNIRIDYAVGTNQSSGLYFAIGEAF